MTGGASRPIDQPSLRYREEPRCRSEAASVPPRGLSSEVFLIPDVGPGRFIVYAPLRRTAFVANAALVNVLADLATGGDDPAADPDGAVVAFLRRVGMLGAGPAPRPITTHAGEPMPTAVTLFLTTACNLRCTYCYASAGDRPLAMMSLETATRGIDFVCDNAVRAGVSHVDVAYHGGGEPSTNWSVLTASLAYARAHARQRGLRVRAAAATNGVLQDHQIDWMIANLDGLSISCDGLPEVHDASRPMVGGRGSSARVMATLRRLDAVGFPYGLRLTVTHEHVGRLPDSVTFVCEHFRPAGILVEPAYELGRWAGAPSAETEAFIGAYREAQARAAIHGRTIAYSAARLEVLTNHYCGVSQDTFALSPAGNVSACYEAFSEDTDLADIFFYGSPDADSAGYRFDLAVLENLRRQAVQHRAYCEGCFAKWHCAGDCHHRALSVQERGPFTGSARCDITRALLRDQILARIAAAGGIVWHEDAPAPDGRAAPGA